MSTSVKYGPQVRKYIENVKAGIKTKDDLMILYRQLKHKEDNTDDKKTAMNAIKAYLQTTGVSIVATRSRKRKQRARKTRKN